MLLRLPLLVLSFFVGLLAIEERNLQSTAPKYLFLVRNFVPLVGCTVNGNNSLAQFTGYTVQLIQKIAAEFKWTYGKDYGFECVPSYEDIYLRMSNSGNQMIVGEGALRINSTWTAKDIKYSQPTYPSGLRMVVRQKNIRDMWSFAQPISWRVGLGLVISCAIVGVLIWIYEEKNWKRQRKSEHVLNLIEVLYDVFSSFFATNSITLRKWASKLLQWFTWVYVIIFVALYQADLTGKLSSSYFELEIASYDEALGNGAKIATLEEYKSELGGRSFDYRPTGDRNQTMMAIFQDLDERKVDAVIAEVPLVDYYMPQFCNFFMLDDIITGTPYVTAFSKNVDQNTIYLYTQYLTKWQENQQIRSIKKQAFDSGNNPDCGDDNNVITIKELGGLWIILASTAFIAIILFILRKCGWCQTPSNYMPPYYEYYNEKTQLFEEQLKEAVHTELKKIAKNYYEHIEQEIQTFEDTLMLQDNPTGDKKEEVVEIPQAKNPKKVFKTVRRDDDKGGVIVDPNDVQFKEDNDRF